LFFPEYATIKYEWTAEHIAMTTAKIVNKNGVTTVTLIRISAPAVLFNERLALASVPWRPT
jgi:hypothetical protein